MAIETVYHQPLPEVVARVAARVDPAWTTVVEVGPGFLPFPKATHFVEKPKGPASVDYPTASYARNGARIVHADLNVDPLPFANGEVDFLYCRHVIEDLYNPLNLLREIARVARRGYLETPTPIAEWARHIDTPGAPCPWRGYHHHHYLVWRDEDGLVLVPKYPMVELMDLGPMEDTVTQVLAAGPLAWHTRFLWEGGLPFRLLEHDDAFLIGAGYQGVILDGFRATLRTAPRAWAELFPEDA